MNRILGAALLAAFLAWPGAAAALPLISEVFYDAIGADNTFVFIEISAAPGFDLSGLQLEGVNGSGGGVGPVIVLSGIVPADGLFVVADRDASGFTSVLNADLIANFDFQNGPDSVVLRDASGVLDRVGYGNFGIGDVFAGEGTPVADAPPGSSIARLFADIDTGDNGVDFSVVAPTPGTASFFAVPEPIPALLFLWGLGGLWVMGGRSSPA